MRILLAALTLALQTCLAQQELSPNAPPDKPVSGDSIKNAKLNLAILPLIKQAKETYPAAKKRYQSGLPRGQVFFIVTRLHDFDGKSEQVFVRVSTIEDATIFGHIANQIISVKGYREGQALNVEESDIIDWLISKPDGSEEGNIVGKFLDNYKPYSPCGVVGHRRR